MKNFYSQFHTVDNYESTVRVKQTKSSKQLLKS